MKAPSNDIQMRQAIEADQATIRQMVKEARLDPTALHWSHFLVAEREGEVVGIGQIRPYPRCRELGSLVVKREYRKRGVGKLLVEALLANEASEVYLECAIHNLPFYERFGFRRIHWWQAPMPLNLKAGFGGLLARLFGTQLAVMKWTRTNG